MLRKDFALATGKAYHLKVKSTSAKECAWQAPQFVNFVWLRKIEVSKGRSKPATSTRSNREGEAEIFFTPIMPGEYAGGCRGLESKGMAGRFIVK